MYHEHYNIDTIGKMGIVLQSHFYFPKDPQKPEDVEAANRLLQFWVRLQFTLQTQLIACFETHCNRA